MERQCEGLTPRLQCSGSEHLAGSGGKAARAFQLLAASAHFLLNIYDGRVYVPRMQTCLQYTPRCTHFSRTVAANGIGWKLIETSSRRSAPVAPWLMSCCRPVPKSATRRNWRASQISKWSHPYLAVLVILTSASVVREILRSRTSPE